jgi:hypothetical protein
MENMERLKFGLECSLKQANEKLEELRTRIANEEDILIKEIRRQDERYWFGIKVCAESALNDIAIWGD